MSRRVVVFATIAVLFAVTAVQLGFWQLRRLAERRAFNAQVAAQREQPAVPLEQLPADTGAARYRQVLVTGQYDTAHEVLLVSRTYNGSPGVNLVTPLRVPGRDTAVLVNRGWVYAQDAKSVDRARWRELRDSASGTAFLDVYPAGLAGSATSPEGARTIRRLEPSVLRALYPYPIAAYYLVLQPSVADTGTRRDSTPVRLSIPPLSEGSHQSYAIQWFFFATVALVGAVAYGMTDRRTRRQEQG